MVESGIFLSAARVELPRHTFANSSSEFIQRLHGLLRPASTAVVLRCAYRNIYCCRSKPARGWTGLWRATSAISLYIGFQEKAMQNRHAARFAAMLKLFSHRGRRSQRSHSKPAFTPAAEALARDRAPFQASRRPPARLLLPMAVRRSARRSAGPRPNTPSEPRRRESPAG